MNIDDLLWSEHDYEEYREKILDIIKEEHEFSPDGVCVMSPFEIADRCIEHLRKRHSLKIIKYNGG